MEWLATYIVKFPNVKLCVICNPNFFIQRGQIQCSVSNLLSTKFCIRACTSCQNLLSVPGFHNLIHLSFLYFQLKVEYLRWIIFQLHMHRQPSMCKVHIIEPQYLLSTTRTFLHYLLLTTSILSIVGVHVITLSPSNIYHAMPFQLHYSHTKNHSIHVCSNRVISNTRYYTCIKYTIKGAIMPLLRYRIH